MTRAHVRAIRGTVVLLCLASALAGIVAAHTSAPFVGRNGPGFFVFGSAFLAPPFLAPDRSAVAAAGADVLDLVVAVEGAPVTRGEDVWAAARRVPPGAALHYTMERPSGERFEATIPTRAFTAADRHRLLASGWIPGILLLAVAAAAALARPDLEAARVLFLFGWALATGFGMLSTDHLVGHELVPWSFALGPLALASFVHLALVFPERRWPLTRHPRVSLVALYALNLAIFVPYVVRYRASPASAHGLDLLAAGGYLVGTSLLALGLARAALGATDAVARQRARVMLLAPAAGLALAAGGAVFGGWSWRESAASAFSGTVSALPPVVTFAILRRNLFELDAVAHRAIAAIAVGAACALGYLALLLGVRSVAGSLTPAASALVSGACFLAVLPAVTPMRRVAEDGLRMLLFPEQRRAGRVLREVTIELARVRDLDGLCDLVASAAREGVGAGWARVVAAGGGAPPRALGADAAAPVGSGLADVWVPLVAALPAGGSVRLEGAAQPDLAAAAETPLGLRVAVSLPPGDAGDAPRPVLLLGPRRDGRLYTREDVAWLESLAARSAVAFENARAWERIGRLQERLERENRSLREEASLRHDFAGLVGRSAEIRHALAQVERVAPVDVPVIVVGETGTGKELIAEALHALSPRRGRALVKVACAAIPETLFESELFGHEKGAFTGAATSRAGRFESADGGTLFLDDVDTLPLVVQAKLLRALQEGEVQRLGAAQPRRVDVRIVAATNRDLVQEVAAGRFREDLYYRLHVVPVRLPPLRERGDDVVLLAEHFAEEVARELGRPPRPLARSALDTLWRHAWPGNVRELRNAIERAVVMSAGDEIVLGELAPAQGTADRPAADASDDALSLAESLRRLKVSLIRDALARAGGRQREAAALLGLHAQSLSRMMKELGLREG
jgi:transcriptional regulator with GAF, ATPase, and Fis domain